MDTQKVAKGSSRCTDFLSEEYLFRVMRATAREPTM